MSYLESLKISFLWLKHSVFIRRCGDTCGEEPDSDRSLATLGNWIFSCGQRLVHNQLGLKVNSGGLHHVRWHFGVGERGVRETSCKPISFIRVEVAKGLK